MTTPTQKAATDPPSSPDRQDSWLSTGDPASDGVAHSPAPHQLAAPDFEDEGVSGERGQTQQSSSRVLLQPSAQRRGDQGHEDQDQWRPGGE